MDKVLLIMRRFFASVMAFILSFIPFSGGKGNVSEEDVTLKVAIVSDVHIDRRLPVGQAALINCYKDMNMLSPDAVAVLGDLTNYGDYATLERFFELTEKYVDPDISKLIISGNHDIGHAKEADGARTNPEALQDFMDLCNERLGYETQTPYYTLEVNGYHFIGLNDESEDNWDHPEYSDEAIAFLDAELASYAVNGMPVFVLMHVPLSGIHGEENYYPDGGVEEPWNTQIRKTMEKYRNVFCLTGHFHKGLSNNPDTPTYTEKNGVHYLNLTSYLMPNWPADLAVNGLGFVMEVTQNSVTFRCRNYYLHNWYGNFTYTSLLEKD